MNDQFTQLSESSDAFAPKIVSWERERKRLGHRENGNREGCPAEQGGKARIAFQSKIMQSIKQQTDAYANSSATVLITGESGTGKELFARMIHERSRRAKGRYARVNCAALSESLMESELFGHERGAFTGAFEKRVGRFEWAANGTLLLDEISEIPYAIQAKLLRVLEEGEFQRVGNNDSIHSSVRIVATSNQDLLDAVDKKQFRADLYHRLNVLRVHLPPLRERREDIPLLANQFFLQFKSENTKTLDGFASEAMKWLSRQEWSGNVRELRNCIQRACVIAAGNLIQIDDCCPQQQAPSSKPHTPEWLLHHRLDEIERMVILNSLERFSGNKTHTANQLGITTRTLANKLKLYESQGLLKVG